MKVVVIGASHGGITVAQNIKELCPDATVSLVDPHPKNQLGYISNGINLYLNGVISDLKEATTNLSQLNHLGVQFYFHHQVTALSQVDKEVTLTDEQGKVETLPYDFLVLAVGSSPLQELEEKEEYVNLLSYKSFEESKKVLPEIIKAQRIAIIGAGYIGVELADSLKNKNKEIHLFDSMGSVLPKYFDEDMMESLQQKMANESIFFHQNLSQLTFISNKKVITGIASGDLKLPIDLVIAPNYAVPNTRFLQGKIDLAFDDTVKVNDYLQTSDPNIYALGDIVPVVHFLRQTQSFMPLVNRTVRMARTIAMNIAGEKQTYDLWRKTSGTFVFDTFVGSTGLTEEDAPFYGYRQVASTKGHYFLDARFNPQPKTIEAKIVYEVPTLKVLGIQVMSDSFVASDLNAAASVLQRETTLKDLAVYDFCFIPQYVPPFYFINELAYDALKEVSQNKGNKKTSPSH